MSTPHNALRTSFVSIVVNVAFSVTKIVTGIVGNSYALVADGIESAADIVSSVMVWSGLRISENPPDQRHPYGHGKAESLAGFMAALALGGSACVIGWHSVHEILEPHTGPEWFTLWVLIGVIIGKGLMYRFVAQAGKHFNSTALKNDAWHHLSDAITSLAVMVGLLIALIGGDDYAQADDIAALLICGFILYNAYHLIQPSIDEIMDAAAPEKLTMAVRTEAKSVSGVIDIDEIRLRKSGLGYLLDIHVEVAPDISVSAGHDIAHEVKDHLLDWDAINIMDVIVHIEPYGD